MKAKNKIVRLRKRYPLMRPVDIARQVGVSRQYVHTTLRKADLPTSAPSRRRVRHCPICNEIVKTRASVCPGRCRYEYYNHIVACSYCHFQFIMKRYEIVNRYRRGYNNIYCSRQCYYRARSENGN